MNAIFGYLGGGGDKMTIWQKNWVAETIFWDQPWLYQSINYFSRWKNHFGRWKNYFSRWENYFGRWKNYFSMPAVGRLWPSDDNDDAHNDASNAFPELTMRSRLSTTSLSLVTFLENNELKRSDWTFVEMKRKNASFKPLKLKQSKYRDRRGGACKIYFTAGLLQKHQGQCGRGPFGMDDDHDALDNWYLNVMIMIIVLLGDHKLDKRRGRW